MAKKIVIVGGGFAGLNIAKNIKSKEYDIILVDRNNYMFFPPLLYQVATGFLTSSNISYPYRKMFRNKPNIRFKLGEVIKVIPNQNTIELSTGALSYDYLVFATGTETNYFGMENVRKHAIPMKTINDSLEMRNYILSQLEKATNLTSVQEISNALTIVIAGGGPTGVEVAGMLAEMRVSIFRKDYPEFEKMGVLSHIYLVDGAEQLLSPMSKDAQEYTYNMLASQGVKILLKTQVTDYVDNVVKLSDGKTIQSEILIWAAGVTSQIFDGIPAEHYGPGRRLIVDAHNRLLGFDNIYAIGDTCIQKSDVLFPSGHPQVAQVALQQGKNLATNFNYQLETAKLRPFTYKDRGSMAIIGRNKAVADIPPNIHFTGFIAWFMWIFIHIISLIHYRNKITTMYNWVISYFTKDQPLRMIIRPEQRKF